MGIEARCDGELGVSEDLRHHSGGDVLGGSITVPMVEVNTRPESTHAGPSAKASAACRAPCVRRGL